MIKPTELRLNNWVQLADMEAWHIDWPKPQEPFQVTKEVIEDLFINENNGFSMSFLEPIPLTGQWLLDFGFDKKEGLFEKWEGNLLYSYEFGQGLCFGQGMEFSYDIKCDFVHQLQNLYFSLTNKELTTKTWQQHQ